MDKIQYLHRIRQEIEERIEMHRRIGRIIPVRDFEMLQGNILALDVALGEIVAKTYENNELRRRLRKIEESGYAPR